MVRENVADMALVTVWYCVVCGREASVSTRINTVCSAPHTLETSVSRGVTGTLPSKLAMGDTKTDISKEKKEEAEKKVEKPEFSFAVKPVEKHGWEAFSSFVWDPETKKFLGRTGMSWCK